jgi:murein DD-endopeptidase MepM/ murein hydrolase activator NlpD
MFLIGSIIGATALLLYLETTHQLAAAPVKLQSRAAGFAPLPAARGAVPVANVAQPTLGPVDLEMPVQGVQVSSLRSNFDEARGSFRRHQALDILAPRGTPVVAAVDGTIVKLFLSQAGGVTIYEFDRRAERVYYYAHLDRYADGLQEGMVVTRGQVIGYVGTTGNAPPGTPHLHFAVSILTPEKLWWKATPIDPYPLLVSSEEAAAAR